MEIPTGYAYHRYELTAPLSSLPQLRQRNKEQLKLFHMVSIVLLDKLSYSTLKNDYL